MGRGIGDANEAVGAGGGRPRGAGVIPPAPSEASWNHQRRGWIG